MMKRIFASIFVLALSVGLLALGPAWPRGQSKQRVSLTPTVQVQEVKRTAAADSEKARALAPSAECTLSTIVGKFGGTIQGTVLPPLMPEPVSVVAVGSFEIDAAGTLTGADTSSVGGQIIPRTYSGTVSVQGNCTFTGRFTVETGLPGLVVNFSGVILDGGKELHFVETDPGTLFTSVAKRL
jgi:hypothetical protein